MSEIRLTKDNFKTEVQESSIPVLIDFWAPWCGPCQMLGPIIAEVAEELEGKVKVCKVNCDDEPELAAAFKVSSIPTLVVVKDGAVVKSSVGYIPKAEVMALLEI